MSLKEKIHMNTIHKIWVITPHGARQKFGILIFVHEMTSVPLSDHLTPLPCLLSCMNWLLHHLLIISTRSQDMIPLLPPHLPNHPSLHFHTPAATPCPPSPPQHPQDLPQMPPPHLCLNPSLHFHTPAAYHAYASELDP
ncbi:hypothetical protein O181_006774 [Austropuccinia psidii MF-1]|uniref:Uncharacterized protein n=1 Tax=Austropuccinia psidii MF-1 TaxID=1389203 RepID=A0A9Q3BKN9_9BASI|nr:hypothetical protein [Austropuccinia psidii MF-1]